MVPKPMDFSVKAVSFIVFSNEECSIWVTRDSLVHYTASAYLFQLPGHWCLLPNGLKKHTINLVLVFIKSSPKCIGSDGFSFWGRLFLTKSAWDFLLRLSCDVELGYLNRRGTKCGPEATCFQGEPPSSCFFLAEKWLLYLGGSNSPFKHGGWWKNYSHSHLATEFYLYNQVINWIGH